MALGISPETIHNEISKLDNIRKLKVYMYCDSMLYMEWIVQSSQSQT